MACWEIAAHSRVLFSVGILGSVGMHSVIVVGGGVVGVAMRIGAIGNLKWLRCYWRRGRAFDRIGGAKAKGKRHFVDSLLLIRY